MSYSYQSTGQNPSNLYTQQWATSTANGQWQAQASNGYREDPQVTTQYLQQQQAPGAGAPMSPGAHGQQPSSAMYGNGYTRAPPASNNTSANRAHYQQRPPMQQQPPPGDSLDLHQTMTSTRYTSYAQSQSQTHPHLHHQQSNPFPRGVAEAYATRSQPVHANTYGGFVQNSTVTGVARVPSSSIPAGMAEPFASPVEDLSHIFGSPVASPTSALDGWNCSPMTSPPVVSPRTDSTATSASVSPTVSSTAPRGALKKQGKALGPSKSLRKKRRVGDESGDEDDECEGMQGGGGKSGASSHRACAHCKKAKIKCTFPENENTCHRCKASGKQCTIEKRRPPRNPNKREYFLAQLREKDAIIESLLKELYNPYTATPLSVRSVRESTSRADQTNQTVAAWLGRVEDGARAAPVQQFAFDEDGDGAEDGDEEADNEGSVGTAKESPLEEAYPIAQLAELHISQQEGKDKERTKDRTSDGSTSDTLAEDTNGAVKNDVGIVNKDYFKAGPTVDLSQRMRLGQEHTQSNLITYGLVTSDDVEKLFEIYHSCINAFVPLLDPTLHTPKETFARCPCLFTVICAITSRYYPEKKEIYPIAMHFALNECANALMHGWKCIELSQAFILLAVYAHPAKRWEEERSYLYGGLAMRIAIDLNVNIAPASKPKTEKDERELLNRTRLWMICFQTDWQMAAHYGKPSSLKENRIIRSAGDFYLRSEYNLIADVHLCAYNELLRHIAGFHTEVYSDPDSRTGLRKSQNFAELVDRYDGHLTNLVTYWQSKFAEHKRFEGHPIYAFRCKLLPYVVGYTKLIMYSFAFQQAFDRGMQEGDRPLLTKCMEAAKSVVRSMIEELAPTGSMRFAPNGWFNFCSFSSAFLMKLLRPDFANLLSKQDEDIIFSLITRLIDTLSSEKIAIDDKHTPMLWSRFLQELVAKHKKDGAMATIPAAERRVTLGKNPTPQNTLPPPQVTAYPQSAVPQRYDVALHGVPAQNAAYPAWPGQQDTALFGALGLNPNIGMNVGPGLLQPLDMGAQMMVDDDQTLATMAALNNPAFWDNMMLPGFPWPESPSSVAELPILQNSVQPAVGTTWYS